MSYFAQNAFKQNFAGGSSPAAVYSQEEKNLVEHNKQVAEAYLSAYQSNITNLAGYERAAYEKTINILKSFILDSRLYSERYAANNKQQRKLQHLVKDGETLQSISNLYFETPNSWALIFYYNSLTDVKLNSGDILTIPELQNKI